MKLKTVFDCNELNNTELDDSIACITCLQFFNYSDIFEETKQCIDCTDKSEDNSHD